MKRLVVVATVVAMMVGTTCTTQAKENEHSFYAKTTVVTEVDTEEDVVYCVDFNGEEWSFEGVEDWMVGDYCAMVMDDMGTKIIYDDEIVSTRYTGWLNGSFGKDKDGKPIIEIYED